MFETVLPNSWKRRPITNFKMIGFKDLGNIFCPFTYTSQDAISATSRAVDRRFEMEFWWFGSVFQEQSRLSTAWRREKIDFALERWTLTRFLETIEQMTTQVCNLMERNPARANTYRIIHQMTVKTIAWGVSRDNAITSATVRFTNKFKEGMTK
jgi:hypothetical protein